MGFLDQLRQQADALKAQQTHDLVASARHTALVEAACKTTFGYFHLLAEQLNVLQPTSPARFVLDRRHVFEGLRLTTFRLDARRKRVRDEELTDHIVLHWELNSGRTLELTKDFLPDIESLEPRLRQSGAQVDAEAVRDPDSARLQGMRYRLVADFRASVRVTPMHAEGRLRFDLRNVEGFETTSAQWSAIDVGSQRLDELARWLVGQPHAFLRDAIDLRRVPA